MKKIFYTLMIVISICLLTGCQNDENSPPDISKKSKNEEKLIDYKIDKIVLSKGYQSIDPNIEIVKKDNISKLLATLGLMECSGITIDKITKTDNEINIYIDKVAENGQIQLAIPQIQLELNDPTIDKLEDLKFNIINQNYKPIDLKFGKNEMLNKLYSHFKISPDTIPEVDLIKFKDKIVWSVGFDSIFDKENSKNPLINLKVKINADTGEILSSDKKILSNYVDNGIVLDYANNKYLLYKREEKDDNNKVHDTLWIYNLNTTEKKKLYSSKDSIFSAKFNPNHTDIALIEYDDEKSETDMFLISIQSNDVKNITPTEQHHTWFMKWKEDDTLYFVNNDSKDKSTIYKYNINENDTKTVFKIDKNVFEFDIMNETIVFTEFDEEKVNKKIFISNNDSKLTEIDTGFKVTFLKDGKLIYLKNIENENKNIFNVYDIKKDTKNIEMKYDIVNYFPINNSDLTIISKNNCNNDYTLIKYNIKDQSSKAIAKVINDTVFYNEEQNIGYITLSPTDKDSDKNKNVIYSIDLSNLKVDD